MSVIGYEREKFEQLAGSLRGRRDMIFGYAERCALEKLAKAVQKSEKYEKMLENKVDCFCDRLYIANQLAYFYTYKDDTSTIDRIENVRPNCMSDESLLADLRSISYNIISNCGNTFLGADDQKRLDDLINTLTRKELDHMYDTFRK